MGLSIYAVGVGSEQGGLIPELKNNKPVLYEEHFKRLKNSCKILNIDFKIDKLKIKLIINEGIKKLSLKKNQFGSVRINYTRGINRDRSLKTNRNLSTNYEDI